VHIPSKTNSEIQFMSLTVAIMPTTTSSGHPWLILCVISLASQSGTFHE